MVIPIMILIWVENALQAKKRYGIIRGSYKKVILDYIHIKYPDLHEKYREIYLEKNNAYWDELVQFLDDYSRKLGINSINYFYHDKLVKK